MMEDEAVMEAVAEAEAPKPGQEFQASPEALTFMSSIEPVELQRCAFSDSLVAASESCGNLGSFSVTVAFTCRLEQPCTRLEAQSHGVIDGCPCGTTVTAYFKHDLEVLEEDYYEYVKMKGHSVDKQCHMVQRNGQMTIDKVTKVGEEVTKESVSYPMSVLQGLVTEGSSFLLMRLMALRKKVPEHTAFVSLDQQLRVIPTTFSELSLKQLEVGGETLDVFGVERTVHSLEDSPTTWQCYFLEDGRMATRVQVGSPVTMRLLQPLAEREKGMKKITSHLGEDIDFLKRQKGEIGAAHASYLREHPEVRAIVSDFMVSLLLRKPADAVQYAREYFQPFASRHPPKPETKS